MSAAVAAVLYDTISGKFLTRDSILSKKLREIIRKDLCYPLLSHVLCTKCVGAWVSLSLCQAQNVVRTSVELNRMKHYVAITIRYRNGRTFRYN